jgi:hypothetical protein
MVKRNYVRNDFDSIVGHLIEECGEVLAAAGKLLRWGPDSYNPEVPKDQRETNLAWLQREILDLESVITRAKEHIFNMTKLPDIELVSAKVHEAWMDSKHAAGVSTRKLETGEELMVPYDQLSDAAKELDRGTVRAVYAAIEAASH